jgi:hypothetical protein
LPKLPFFDTKEAGALSLADARAGLVARPSCAPGSTRTGSLDHLDARLARHHPVEDQQVSVLGQRERVGLVAVARLDDPVVRAAERLRHQQAQVVVVVGDQDRLHGATPRRGFRQITGNSVGWARSADPPRAGLPGIDAGALLSRARRRRGHRCERACDPAPRVGRVDHVVDLEHRRHVHRLPDLVHARDHLVE